MITFESQSRLPWNRTDSLTVTSVRPNSTNATATVTRWAYYPGPIREAEPSNGVFQLQDATVTFDSDATVWPLKPRDTLAFDSQTWTVTQCQKGEMLKFWRVELIRLVMQADLCDTIQVFRPTVSATADGLRQRTLSQVGSNVLGRLQPDGWQAEQDTAGRLTKRERWKAFLATPVTLLAGDVLRVGGVDYEVTGQGQQDQLRTFAFANCQRIG